MPIKSIVAVMVAVIIGALLWPDESMIIIWIGGMALLWIITGNWVPPSRKPVPQDTTDAPPHAAEPEAVEADMLRPAAGTMEAEDLDDLARLDGVPMETETGKDGK